MGGGDSVGGVAGGGEGGVTVRARGVVSVSSEALEGRGWMWVDVLRRVHDGSRHRVGAGRGSVGEARDCERECECECEVQWAVAVVETDELERSRAADETVFGQGLGPLRPVARESDAEAFSAWLEGRPVTLRPGV
jgi:hypothetical protein